MSIGKVQRGLALTATIIASSMGFIDSTIVHIALPSIQQDLDTSFASLQWIANIYLLALCALMVISGALGDKYGPRRLFITGIVGFTLASAACAAATSGGALIVARMFQGIGAALMLPQSLSIIARLYPPERRGKAVGMWSMSAAAAAAAGPVIGGMLVDNGGWPYAFWVNLPLGVIALVLTVYTVPRGNQRKEVALDWPGSALLVCGLGAFVFSTINLSLFPVWSVSVLPGWVIGVVLLSVFFWWERRAAQPVLPAHLMVNREFVLLNAYCITIFASFTAMMFLVPYLLIISLGLSASAAALNMLPMGVCISLMARPVGAWADRVGYRTPMIYGALGIALATALAGLIVWLRTPWAGAVAMGCLGVTAGLMVTPLTTGVLNSVHTEESGLASGINHAVSRIGSLLSVALFGAALALRYQQRLPQALDAVIASDQDKQAIAAVIAGAAEAVAAPDLSELALRLQLVAMKTLTQALDAAFIEVMIAASVCALAAAAFAMALGRDLPFNEQYNSDVR